MVEINNPQALAEVTEAFGRYEKALIANDVATLNAMFWRNDLTVRYGVAENLYGHAAIAEFRSTQPAMDLTRDLMNTVITTYGADTATANTEFRRIGSKLTGRQSQTWLRTDEGWRIASAHVSLLPQR